MREIAENPICLFDLDGVLADHQSSLVAGLLEIASSQLEQSDIELLKTTHDFDTLPVYLRKRINLIRNKPKWWSRLPEYNIGFRIIDIACELGFQIHILSKPPYDQPTSLTEKVEWAYEHVTPYVSHRSQVETSITLTRHKHLVYGKVFVDDDPDQMKNWINHRPRGLGIMPMHPYNNYFEHPQVVKTNGENIEEVYSRMNNVLQEQVKTDGNIT